jgi:two-component system, LytTR family, response regulator
MKLNCAIIDDEPNAVSLLEILIRDNTQWDLLYKCHDAAEALNFFKVNRPDFVFLDINMPGLNGMELASLLPEQIKIIFTTAYSEYAVESYRFQTIDYLLKPVTIQRFIASTIKIEKYFHEETFEVAGSASDSRHFFVKTGKTFKKIRLDDIQYVESEKEYVKLVSITEEILLYRRLKEVEEQLPAPFIRIHNSFIVNSLQIIKIEDNHVYIKDKRIPIGDKFREKFMALIQKRMF